MKRSSMLSIICKRVLRMIIILWVMTLCIFILMQFSGVDPVSQHFIMAGTTGDAATIEAMRHQLGLDRPMYEQYISWILGIFTGNLGYSLAYGQDISTLVSTALPNTLFLCATATIVSLSIVIPLGLLSFNYKNSWIDYIIRTGSFVGISLPTFWVALLLIWFFSLHLRLIPVTTTDSIKGMILPTVALSIWMVGLYIRRFRTSLLEETRKPYIKGALALGLPKSKVIAKYLIPNALPSILPMMGMTLGNILGGTAVIETVFGWRGMGQLMTTAVIARDYQLIQTYVLWGASSYILVCFLADLACIWLDPRRRIGGQ